MRDQILKVLKKEGHVSGEQLAKKFSISRTAIWKHIKELRKMGYEIESHPRYGYLYVKDTDLLAPEEITTDLGTHVMGSRVLHRKEVTSTQDIVDKLARVGVEEGLVIIAEEQTKGRGRRGRTWVSPAKDGIYISLLLRPNLKPLHIIQIPLVAGLALVRAIELVVPLHPTIKWPNDVCIGNRKVAGILTEVNCDIDEVRYIVLGLGINVNTKLAILPEQVRPIATSLAEECKQPVSRVNLIRQFLVEFEKVYGLFLTSGFHEIGEQWKKYDTTIGSRVKVMEGAKEIEGQALDIDVDGFLIVKSDDGKIKRIISADVTSRN